jgi:hypothetical protein
VLKNNGFHNRHSPFTPSFGSGASLALDFTSGNRTLDPRITFSRTTNATVTGSNGLIQNAPMNLLTFSEQFDNAAWTKSNATVTANSTVSPDGATTSDLIIPSAVSNTHLLLRTTTMPASSPMTFSVYAKASGYGFVVLRLDDGSVGISATFNVSTGEITVSAASFGFGWTAPTASLTSVGNGWYRCTLSGVSKDTTSIRQIAFINNVSSDYNGSTYTGNGTSGVFLWGAQLELGSTATTYNPTTVKNLLGFTENFDNAAWTKSNASISATKVDDIYGQPFAQKLVENTATDGHEIRGTATVAAAPYTFSCYLKADGRNFAMLFISGINTATVFNLATGATAGNAGFTAPTSAAITSVGNGWYRCSVTATTTAASLTFRVYMMTDATTFSYTGDGTSGIYIFGAQLSDSASVDPYVYQPVAAPTSTAYYGPRFDYDPVTLAPKGLLIEEQRTNLLLRSEEFDNVAWIKGGSTVTANAIASPDGLLSADLLTANAGAFSGNVTPTVAPTISSGTAYTLSAYVKKNNWRYVGLRFNTSVSGGTEQIPFYDFDTDTVSNGGVATATITRTLVGNGWVRLALTFTSTSVLGVAQIWLTNSSGATAPAKAGTESVYLWGAQLEAGAFATSYIPTVASQVTRAADSASMIGNNFARWYNVSEGSVFTEADTSRVAGDSSNIFTISDGTMDNRITAAAATQYHFYVSVAGVPQANIDVGTYVDNVFSKNAGAYKVNDFADSLNGSVAGTDTSGTLPVVNRLALGANAVAGGQINGHIKRIAYYPRRLANSELQAITA